ncbi:MAG: hypothetical protein WDA16_12190, partial [Candidatus Thermoplasmatota archaeon]
MFEHFPRFGVAKEVRDRYDEVLAKALDLVCVLAQERHVIGEAVDLVEPHAPVDAPREGPGLVGAIIEGIPAGLQHREDAP